MGLNTFADIDDAPMCRKPAMPHAHAPDVAGGSVRCGSHGMYLAQESAGILGHTQRAAAMNVSANEVFPQIAGYEMTRRLGRGGMADVYLGTQLSLSRPVAIKVLAAERTEGEDTVARFEHEARTIARLDHPDIVSIYDVGRTTDGRLYYTMPYLSHGDLSARDLHGEQAAIAAIVRALCRALAYAHQFGIVHRDVKPENILFDNLDRPLLADFGIALSTRNMVRVTREGSTIGSTGYASPEQARGFALDGRADLYSLGVVAYELLSGDLPFHGVDTLSMALAHVEQPIPRLPRSRHRWQAFIDKAMAKNPADRFQSAAQMQAALDAIVTDLGNPASGQPGRRWPVGLITACVAIALGTVMLAMLIMHRHTTQAVAATQDAAIHLNPAASTTSYSSVIAPTSAAANAGSARSASDDHSATVITDKAAASAPNSQIAARPVAPATASSAPESQATITDLRPGMLLRDRDGPELVFVPAAREGSVHGFLLARYEVTRAEYAAFVRASGRGASKCREPQQLLSRFGKLSWRNPGFVQNERHPAVCVSWSDAIAYAQWLSQRTHAEYRLPTRAQWLHAARSLPNGVGACAQGNLAGRGALPFHIGSGPTCKGGYERTAPVGHFKPNALGVYDLVGNVSEWVLDCKPSGIDAKGHCGERLFTGTSWQDNAGANNLEVTGDAAADLGYTMVGIRLLRKLDADNMPAVVR